MRLRAAKGYSSEQLAQLRAVRLPHSVVAEFAGETRPFVLGALAIAAFEGAPSDLTSPRFAVAPLHFEGQRYGCISGGCARRGRRVLPAPSRPALRHRLPGADRARER